MSLFNRPLDKISFEDIEELMRNQTQESLTLEYKCSLPDNSPDSKYKFLASITAMANSGGGDIIFGIRENNDTEEVDKYRLEGLPISEADIDNGKTRLNDLIADGIEPHMHNLLIESMKNGDGRIVFILRVPSSVSFPHMIKPGRPKFYYRDSSGKRPMDYHRIKQAFLTGDKYFKKAKGWIDERMNVLKTDKSLYNGATLIIHITPLIQNSFSQNSGTSNKKLIDNANSIYADFGFKFQSISEGIEDRTSDNLVSILLTRFGQIEFVSKEFFTDSDDKTIPSNYEYSLIEHTKTHLKLLEEINISPPFLMRLTLLGVRGYTIDKDKPIDWRLNTIAQTPIKDEDIISNVTINDFNENIELSLKPAFDKVWNACNIFYGSYNYDKEGNWVQDKRR